MTKQELIPTKRAKPLEGSTFGAASEVAHLDPKTTAIHPQRNIVLTPGRHIFDAWDDIWTIADSRRTDHNFAIYLGRPKEATGPMGPAIIITADLAEHFEKHRRTPKNLNLPIGKFSITRIRRILGHHRYQDAEMWWLERVTDLERLTIADFAAKHRVSAGAISQARRALTGIKQRPANWWRTPEMQDLLHSKMPTAWIAERMGIAAPTVRRYRTAV